jgi:DNA polymerase III epsilon subunit family exonuclease
VAVSLLDGARIAVVDTETTGFSPAEGHALVEVAVVRLAGVEPAAEWSTLMHPGRPIPPDASRIHGITDAMVQDAPGPAEVARRLREEIGERVLVFHNAPFDLPFLIELLRAQGQPPILNPIIDTLGLARGLYPEGGNGLEALARRLGIEAGEAHRALGDARTTARVLRALARAWEEQKRVTSLLELAAISLDVMRETARAGGPGRR